MSTEEIINDLKQEVWGNGKKGLRQLHTELSGKLDLVNQQILTAKKSAEWWGQIFAGLIVGSSIFIIAAIAGFAIWIVSRIGVS